MRVAIVLLYEMLLPVWAMAGVMHVDPGKKRKEGMKACLSPPVCCSPSDLSPDHAMRCVRFFFRFFFLQSYGPVLVTGGGDSAVIIWEVRAACYGMIAGAGFLSDGCLLCISWFISYSSSITNHTRRRQSFGFAEAWCACARVHR